MGRFGVFFLLQAVLLLSVVAYPDELRFREDGTFKIVQFTDIHYEDNPIHDVENYESEKEILKHERPDLVILTGDVISGAGDPRVTGHLWFETLWKTAVRPMEELGIPWAWTCGNHEDEGLMTRKEIAEFDQTFNLSLTQKGPADLVGVTNYPLRLLPSNSSGPDAEPRAMLWMFDSMGYDCVGIDPGYGCIDPSVVTWYREKSDHHTPGLAFFHIPLVEQMTAYNAMETYGEKGEPVCCPSANSGMFSAMMEVGDIKWTFCGHDHHNDYYVRDHGISLYYGRCSGWHADKKKGARVIELSELPFGVTTWIREKDGKVIPEAEQPKHTPSPDAPQGICCRSVAGPEKPYRM